jgi:hypothetical protein
MLLVSAMFDILKKKPEPKEREVAEKQEEAAEKPQKTLARPRKTVKEKPVEAEPAEPEAEEAPAPKVHATVEAAEEPFVGIVEHGSAVEIAEKIDREIAATKTALGEYLRQLDDVRSVAEKSKRLHDVVAKVSGKKQQKEKTRLTGSRWLGDRLGRHASARVRGDRKRGEKLPATSARSAKSQTCTGTP